jgi:hypothetical protein
MLGDFSFIYEEVKEILGSDERAIEYFKKYAEVSISIQDIVDARGTEDAANFFNKTIRKELRGLIERAENVSLAKPVVAKIPDWRGAGSAIFDSIHLSRKVLKGDEGHNRCEFKVNLDHDLVISFIPLTKNRKSK